ncbi:MAG: DNA mismatch repair endonuclease MutL [Pseudomonadota bacterium]
MTIKILSDKLINRIAAGEVIERPASVVKELVENSIDSKATNIDITLHQGGKNYISVSDNGHGIAKDDLAIAIQRHATSKLIDEHNLFNINSLGFRGEALPSIGAVSRLSIKSNVNDSTQGWQISINGGDVNNIHPILQKMGTNIEVRDLFYATPVRLKFLKNDRTEMQYATDIIKRLAIANPHISFSISNEQKEFFKVKKTDDIYQRLSDILAAEFIENSLKVDFDNVSVRLSGLIGLPTYNKPASNAYYIYVNNRPVKDKFIYGAIRSSYQDFLASNRHPALALFITLDNMEVDVNVHPTKSEVRFRDNNLIRKIIISTIKEKLASVNQQNANIGSAKLLSKFQAPNQINTNEKITDNISNNMQNTPLIEPQPMASTSNNYQQYHNSKNWFPKEKTNNGSNDTAILLNEPDTEFINPSFYNKSDVSNINNKVIDKHILEQKIASKNINTDHIMASNTASNTASSLATPPLGFARCQLHATYIVAQTESSIILVDQHAAHERIVYEQMKESIAQNGIKKQQLLIPEIIELDPEEYENIINFKNELISLGFSIENFGSNSIIIRELPAILQYPSLEDLIKNLASDLKEYGDAISLNEKIQEICGNIACHGSIRSGRILNIDEMNNLLRQMENTPNTGQCNHGRPTYVELNLIDIEKIFGRR